MAQIQLRRDTANNWQTANPILAQGEVGVDLTNKTIKLGDGATAWNNLNDYAGSYNDVTNKPTINGVTINGTLTGSDLGLQNTLTAGTNITITEDGTISATGGGEAPANMVTTDTDQTITGEKTIAGNTPLKFGLDGSFIEYNSTNDYLKIVSNGRLALSCSYVSTSSAPIRAKQYQVDSTYNVCSHDSSTTTLTFGDKTRKAIFQCNEPLTIKRNSQSYTNIDSGNLTTTLGMSFWKGTQTEYESIATKDSNTLYIITGA